MKVLVACEESQRVCTAFREKGHEAYSCDIIEPSGGHPEWHIQGDALKTIGGGTIITMDGIKHDIGRWDLTIAHPPCTYLSNCATRSHSIRMTPLHKINIRTLKRIEAMRFFMAFALADCDRIAIENPVGVMNTCYRKPDQTIHPYMFAESENDTDNYVTKATCLWLEGLPILRTGSLPRPNNKELFGVSPTGKAYTWEERVTRDRERNRSKTFPAIASAMAEQWGTEDV